MPNIWPANTYGYTFRVDGRTNLSQTCKSDTQSTAPPSHLLLKHR